MGKRKEDFVRMLEEWGLTFEPPELASGTTLLGSKFAGLETVNFDDSRFGPCIPLTSTLHSLDAGRCPRSRGRRHGEALLAKQNA